MPDNPNFPPQFDYISPVHFWVQKVLPLVYDDALSYYEVLSKVVLKLNEIIEIVNPIGTGIESTIQAYLDQYKTQWEAELQTFQNTINQTIITNNQALNQRIDSLTASVNQQIANNKTDTDQQISDLNAKVLQQIATLAATISTTDEANRVWTLSQIATLKQELTQNYPPVIDPTDGLLESVQTALNHMWDAWRENALTATEYDALELTATEYDGKELTATAYDRYGKILLDTQETTVYVAGVPLNKSAINLEVMNHGSN